MFGEEYVHGKTTSTMMVIIKEWVIVLITNKRYALLVWCGLAIVKINLPVIWTKEGKSNIGKKNQVCIYSLIRIYLTELFKMLFYEKAYQMVRKKNQLLLILLTDDFKVCTRIKSIKHIAFHAFFMHIYIEHKQGCQTVFKRLFFWDF